MVALAFGGAVALLAALLSRSARAGRWCLATGLLLLALLYAMGRLRIPWPDLGRSTVFVLSPYLLVTLGYLLAAAGALALLLRRMRRGPTRSPVP
jgi:hypothetical protein